MEKNLNTWRRQHRRMSDTEVSLEGLTDLDPIADKSLEFIPH